MFAGFLWLVLLVWEGILDIFSMKRHLAGVAVYPLEFVISAVTADIYFIGCECAELYDLPVFFSEVKAYSVYFDTS